MNYARTLSEFVEFVECWSSEEAKMTLDSNWHKIGR